MDGSNPRQLTRGLASEQQCTFACHVAPFSPDGSRLAYSTSGRPDVWTMRASDGRWLLFFSPRGGNFDIYRVPLNDEGEGMSRRAGQGRDEARWAREAGRFPTPDRRN